MPNERKGAKVKLAKSLASNFANVRVLWLIRFVACGIIRCVHDGFWGGLACGLPTESGEHAEGERGRTPRKGGCRESRWRGGSEGGDVRRILGQEARGIHGGLTERGRWL